MELLSRAAGDSGREAQGASVNDVPGVNSSLDHSGQSAQWEGSGSRSLALSSCCHPDWNEDILKDTWPSPLTTEATGPKILDPHDSHAGRRRLQAARGMHQAPLQDIP